MPLVLEEAGNTHQGDLYGSYCLVLLMPSVPEEANSTRQRVCSRSVNCAARGGESRACNCMNII